MDHKLLDVLACPICKGKLQYKKETQTLLCKFDKLAYPIIDGIPIMLQDAAHKFSNEHTEEEKK